MSTFYSEHPARPTCSLLPVQIPVTVNLQPTLSSCKATIYSESSVVAESDCWADGVDPVAAWLRTASPTSIKVSYRADFTAGRTPRVNYVQNSPVPLGIVLATFTVTLPIKSESTIDMHLATSLICGER